MWNLDYFKLLLLNIHTAVYLLIVVIITTQMWCTLYKLLLDYMVRDAGSLLVIIFNNFTGIKCVVRYVTLETWAGV